MISTLDRFGASLDPFDGVATLVTITPRRARPTRAVPRRAPLASCFPTVARGERRDGAVVVNILVVVVVAHTVWRYDDDDDGRRAHRRWRD